MCKYVYTIDSRFIVFQPLNYLKCAPPQFCLIQPDYKIWVTTREQLPYFSLYPGDTPDLLGDGLDHLPKLLHADGLLLCHALQSHQQANY